MNKIQLHRDLPGYANLTAEQKITADRWDAEKEAREKIISEAENDDSHSAWKKALNKMTELVPKYCEHDRYYLGTCHSCDEIARICFGKEDGEFE